MSAVGAARSRAPALSAALRARVRALPAALWLALIVAASIGVRVALARRIVAPWIMVDELVYSELAKSFAAHGSFLVRGVPSTGYGIVYPVLIAPAWRLFGSVPSAYTAAKAINSVLMSLAAVPAYLLARRLLPRGFSLAAALLAVLVPEMLYTGMLMTENAFYPIFLGTAALLVATLERPSAARQLGLLALVGLAYETRAQAVALLAAVATAPALLALVRGEGVRRGLAPFRLLYGVLGVAVLAALAETTARGRSPFTLLGAYDAATSSSYSAGGVSRYLLYHLGALDLELGIVPFAALVALWLTPRRGERARQAFAVASFAVSVWVLAEVSAFASQPSVARIEERNMFYLVPFGLVALLALARERVVPQRGRAALAAALAAGVLPFFVPYSRLIGPSAVSDTFVLLPWWWVQDHWITLGQVRYAALGVGVAGAAVFLRLPRRYALALPAVLAVYLLGTTAIVDNGRHGIHADSLASLWAGTHQAPDWLDRRLGASASVAVLWSGPGMQPYGVWENEFFNRSVGTVFDLDGAPTPDPLPETPARRGPGGVLEAHGVPVRAAYVLASASVALEGRLLVADGAGVDLYRVGGPVRLLPPPVIGGVYPNGTWSGAQVSWRQRACPGGTLAVELASDGSLYRSDQVVTAHEAGRVVGRAVVAPTAEVTLTVPLAPRAAICSVLFTLARTLVPARVEPGATDPRPLGAHVLQLHLAPP